MALSCGQSLCSPPCSSPLADASWLPIYEEAEEAVDFIMAFVSSLDKVTVASRTVAVLAFAGRGFAGLWRGAGWAELPFSQCSGPAGCVHPPTLPVCVSVPRLPGHPQVHISEECLRPVQDRPETRLDPGHGFILPNVRSGGEYQGEGTPGVLGMGTSTPGTGTLCGQRLGGAGTGGTGC